MLTNGQILSVGPGKDFATLNEAIAASRAGDTIRVEAGTYESDYAKISHDLTITGVNGLVHLRAVDPIPNRKAILVTNGDVTIENVKFSDASVPDRNGAGIRHESGHLIVRNSVFENNEDGILTTSNPDAMVTIEGSEFIGNGFGDGRSHGIYVNRIANLTVEDSVFRDTKVGHHIKSRAEQTTILNSTIDDGGGDASYSVDLPNGGQAVLEGNTIIQTALANINNTMVAYGAEGNPHSENSLLVKGNTFVDHHAKGKGVKNFTDVVVVLENNDFQDVETIAVGPHEIVEGTPSSDTDQRPVDDTGSVDQADDEPSAVDAVLDNDTDTAGDADNTNDGGSAAETDTPTGAGGSSIMAEFGSVSLDHTGKWVSLENSYVDPVVIAVTPSFNGGNQVSVRFTDITANSFRVLLDEPSNHDDFHATETVSYFVVEAGTWTLADGTKLQADTVTSNNVPADGFDRVAFDKAFDDAPVVLTQLQTFNGGDFANARKDGTTATGFDVAIEEQESLARTGHANEEIGWVAIEEGSGRWNGHRYFSDIVADAANHTNSRLDFGDAFTGTPEVFAQTHSANGGDPVSTRYKSVDRDGVTVALQEDQTRDSETWHVVEDMDLFALQGSGTLSADLWA